MKKILSIAVLIGIAQICFSQINWKNDIDTLRVELPKKHINLFFHLSELEYNAVWIELKINVIHCLILK